MPFVPDPKLLIALVDAARKAGARGLCVSTSGNASVRLSPERFAVSSSGAELSALRREQIAVCGIDPESHVAGPRPSMESPFHAAIYRTRPDVGAVLHFQSPYATALACGDTDDLDLNFIPEVPAYLGEVAIVPFHLPGTEALSEAVTNAFGNTKRRASVLRNHGQITVGATLDAALQRAEFLELACRIATIGGALERYDAGTIEALRAYGSR